MSETVVVGQYRYHRHEKALFYVLRPIEYGKQDGEPQRYWCQKFTKNEETVTHTAGWLESMTRPVTWQTGLVFTHPNGKRDVMLSVEVKAGQLYDEALNKWVGTYRHWHEHGALTPAEEV